MFYNYKDFLPVVLRAVADTNNHSVSVDIGRYGKDCDSTIFKRYTWSDNKVRELIAVKVLHTSLLNTTAVAFKALPLGGYAPMPAPSPPFKTIL